MAISRRSFVTALWAAPVSLFPERLFADCHSDGSDIGHSLKRVDTFGGEGGKIFSLENTCSIGLRGQTAGYVEQLTINGTPIGGYGGMNQGTIVMADDEYISYILVRHSNNGTGIVEHLEFKTNKGRKMSAGGQGGVPTELTDIRVVAIGGRGQREKGCLERFDVEYIENFKA